MSTRNSLKRYLNYALRTNGYQTNLLLASILLW